MGRVLPSSLWAAALSCLDETGLEPWERRSELVPADLFCALAGPGGVVSEVGVALQATTCEALPALLREPGD